MLWKYQRVTSQLLFLGTKIYSPRSVFLHSGAFLAEVSEVFGVVDADSPAEFALLSFFSPAVAASLHGACGFNSPVNFDSKTLPEESTFPPSILKLW